MIQDPYQTLGISPTATLAEARVAYTKRVRVLHPDRFDPVSQKTEWELANQMLQEVNEAWDTVRNIIAFSPNRGVVPPPIPRPAPAPPQPQKPYAVSPKPRGRTASPSAQRNMAIICVVVVITAYLSFLVAGGYRTASPVPVALPSPANLPTPAEITASTMAEAVHMELQKSRDDATKAMVQRIEAESLAKLAQAPVNLTVIPPVDLVKTSEFSSATNARLDGVMQKAKSGDKAAERELGCDYLFGMGVVKDYALALAWFNKASGQGDAVSQNYIADMYMNGLGVPKDYQQALTWCKKATDQGNAVAQDNMGLIYETGGWGVDQDYVQALNWYQKAADQGDADAQKNIGNMYFQGWGVAKDYSQALGWYQKSAEQGYAEAQNNIGTMYCGGWGVAQDYSQALNWYQKAADQRNPDAQKNIGAIYENGWGVAKDTAMAVQWYKKAAALGQADARAALTRLSDTQQTEAQAHSYKDSSGNIYLVSDADYQRLLPIKSALDVESQILDRLEAQEASMGNRIRQDRENLDNTDSVAVDNFNTEVDTHNSSQVYIQKRTAAFNTRADDFNRELHRVGTLIKTTPSPTVSPTK